MDLAHLRSLLEGHASVVVVEEGQEPLVIQRLQVPEPRPPEERVPISSVRKVAPAVRTRQEEILDRLNREILALREEVREEESR
jgi:hypothetical protein